MAVSRELADQVIGTANLSGTEEVRVDARNLDVNTLSFVSQLIKRITEVGIKEIELVGGGSQWLQEVSKEATAKGLILKNVDSTN